MFGRKRLRKPRVPKTNSVLLKQFFIGFMLLLLVGGLIWGLWHVARLPVLTITEIEVKGGDTVSHEEIIKVAERELAGDYHRFVPKRFAWTYPDMEIASSVRALPRVKDVTVSRLGGQSILIEFSEYHPRALWCKLENGGVQAECFFIDEGGYAFASAPPLSGSSFIRYTDSRQNPTLGPSPFEYNFLKESETLVGALSDSFNFKFVHVERIAAEEALLHLSPGGEIKFTTRQKVNETIRALDAILTSAEFEHLQPGNFEYIDLRYGNKVFVKEQDEPEEEEDVIVVEAEEELTEVSE